MTTDKTRDSLLRILETKSSLAGRFVDVRRIDPGGGGGHFSMLVTAMETETHTRVAIKVFDPLKRGDAYRLACFDRETEILEQLRGQPDILELIHARESFRETLTTTAGIPVDVEFTFFAIELAEKNGLQTISTPPFDAETGLVHFRSMCRAVQRLHKADLVHRDLKPENFLMMRNGAMKLADFGTARSLAPGGAILSAYSFWPGDLRYSSPEVLAGLHDEQPSLARGADMFALGAILFEIFSGTLLGIELFDSAFASDLAAHMTLVPVADRRRVFDAIIQRIKDAHPIPTVEGYHHAIPGSIRRRVDELIRELSDIDYRTRVRDFASVFRRIEICLVILRNEEQYQRWRATRRARRMTRLGSR